MNSSQPLPEKIRIARSFGDAASTYDRYAHIQRDIAKKLFAQLNAEKTEQILDLGSGTGHCATHLASSFPSAEITSLDIAEDMLIYARQESVKRDGAWVCGDAELLPFGNESFDLVVSNLTLQWCHNPENIFAEILRIMKSGGRALLSTLAEGTLSELRDSWAAVDDFVHVNHFLSYDAINKALAEQAFSDKQLRNSQKQYYYESLQALSVELKGIGANNLNAGQSSGLTGKRKLKKLKSEFEQYRVNSKGIPVTYDLVLIDLVK
ncbi:MAG: malonyl-ACP O-methyltransferase BioC [Gammaproteobacteria bacterium]|nr:malonyl-ACP O-methyltransferase BioC [Gammaproteobacteria bacterium]